MSTGYLQSAGVWIEANDDRPPLNVLLRRAPLPSSDMGLNNPAWFIPTGGQTFGLAFLGQDLKVPPPPLRQPKDFQDPTIVQVQFYDQTFNAPWRDQGGLQPRSQLPRKPQPGQSSEPPWPPSLWTIDALDWQQGHDARRPLPSLRQPRPDEAPSPAWFGLTGSPPDITINLLPLYAAAGMPIRSPTRPLGPPQEGPPVVYATEALYAWRGQEAAPRGLPPRRPVPSPDGPPTIFVDVASWTAALAPQTGRTMQQPPRPPQPSAEAPAALWSVLPLDVSILSAVAGQQQPPPVVGLGRKRPNDAGGELPSDLTVVPPTPLFVDSWRPPLAPPRMPKQPDESGQEAAAWLIPAQLIVVAGPYYIVQADIWNAGVVAGDIGSE